MLEIIILTVGRLEVEGLFGYERGDVFVLLLLSGFRRFSRHGQAMLICIMCSIILGTVWTIESSHHCKIIRVQQVWPPYRSTRIYPRLHNSTFRLGTLAFSDAIALPYAVNRQSALPGSCLYSTNALPVTIPSLSLTPRAHLIVPSCSRIHFAP